MQPYFSSLYYAILLISGQLANGADDEIQQVKSPYVETGDVGTKMSMSQLYKMPEGFYAKKGFRYACLTCQNGESEPSSVKEEKSSAEQQRYDSHRENYQENSENGDLERSSYHNPSSSSGNSYDNPPSRSGSSYDNPSSSSGNSYHTPPSRSGSSYDNPPSRSESSYDNPPSRSESSYHNPPSRSGNSYDNPPSSSGNSYHTPPSRSGSSYDNPPSRSGNSYDNPPSRSGNSYDNPPSRSGSSYDNPPSGSGNSTPVFSPGGSSAIIPGNVTNSPVNHRILDQRYEDDKFSSEVDRLREDMERRTQAIHRSYPKYGGGSHRTEMRTHRKYVNGQPVYMRNDEKRYRDGKLVHNVTEESGSSSATGGSISERRPYSYLSNHMPTTSGKENTRGQQQSNHPPSSNYMPSTSGKENTRGQQQSNYPSSRYGSDSRYTEAEPYPYKGLGKPYTTETREEHEERRTSSQYYPGYQSLLYNKDTQNRYYPSVYTSQQRSAQTGTRDVSSGASTYPTSSSHQSNIISRPHRLEQTYDKAPSILPQTYQSYYALRTSNSSNYKPGARTSHLFREDWSNVDGTTTTTSKPPAGITTKYVRPFYSRQSQYPTSYQSRPTDYRYQGRTYHDRLLSVDRDYNDSHSLGERRMESEFRTPSQGTQTKSSYQSHDYTTKEGAPEDRYLQEGRGATYQASNVGVLDTRDSAEVDEEERYDISPLVDGGGETDIHDVPEEDFYYPHSDFRDHGRSPNFSVFPSASTANQSFHSPSGYGSTNVSSLTERKTTTFLPSRWSETKTVWKYLNGILVSETIHYKYYKNGILIHENTTERTRDQMSREGVDVRRLDLTATQLDQYGLREPSRTQSQRHEVHQIKRFLNGQQIYDLNEEKLFQDGKLVHETTKEKDEDDFGAPPHLNQQLIRSQQTGLSQQQTSLSQHTSQNSFGESLRPTGYRPNPSSYRHEVHQEEEFINGQKIYDLHHEQKFQDGKLIHENRSELGPDDLGTQHLVYGDAMRGMLEGNSPTAQNRDSFSPECVTCSNLKVSDGQIPFGSTYKQDLNTEERYESGNLVRGIEDRKRWQNGHYNKGPSEIHKGSFSLGTTTTGVDRPGDGGCSYNHCINGGSCKPHASLNTCVCPLGFRGMTCEEAYCPRRFCRYGGICSISEGRHLCGCTQGYSGNRCSTVVHKANIGVGG